MRVNQPKGNNMKKALTTVKDFTLKHKGKIAIVAVTAAVAIVAKKSLSFEVLPETLPTESL